MRNRYLTGIVIALAACSLLSHLLSSNASADSIARAELEEFLEAGWTKTPQAYDDAEKRFAELAAKFKNDSRVDYAFALIKLRHLKYAEAEKLAADILDDHPNDIHARRLRIWINVSRRQFDKALNEIVKLAKSLPPEGETAGDQNDEADEIVAAGFMGRVFGFLEGPVASNVNENVRNDSRERIVASLGPKCRTAFQDGRNAVSEKYLELSDRQAGAKEKAKNQKQEEKDQKLKELGNEKDEIGRKSERLKEENDKLKSEVKARLEDLEKKDRPLAAKFAQLDTQVTNMRGQLRELAADITIMQGRLDTEKDPFIRGQIRNQIDLENRRAARLDAQIDNMTLQAANVASQRTELQRQGAAIQGQAFEEADGQNRAFEDLQRKQKSTESQEKRLKKSNPAGDSAEVRARSSVINAFVTYEQFPLEQERERLIDSVSASKK